MSLTNYRPDIDGLRAIAVLTVIIFHFNNQWLPGGFIGVDIFFVISGYIITRIIYSQMLSNSFSFTYFYIKRIKRILPLFYLVALTTLAMAWLILMPDDFVGLADSVRYASVFIANIYFEKNTGYFAAAADTMPLLHMWSLSVEEQYYFVWPCILLLSIKLFSKAPRMIFFIFLLITLGIISEWAARSGTAAAYYLIQNRSAELLVGALLSIWLHNNNIKKIALNEGLIASCGLVGAAVLVGFFFLFNESYTFPGINALVVAAATAMVILNGELRRGKIYNFLSIHVLAFIGRLSFSLYLWHWPVLVFYKYYFNKFTIVGYIACAAITFLLSFCSWQFFEKPLRYLNIKSKWVFLFYLLIPIAFLITISKDIKKNSGYEIRLPQVAKNIYQTSISDFSQLTKKERADNAYLPFELLPIGKESLVSQPPLALLWGDSHGGHFRGFIEELGLAKDFYSLYGGLGGCPPFIGVDLIKHGKPESECTLRNNQLLETIKRSSSEVVFLAGRWAMYTETTRSPGEKGSIVFLGDSSDYSESRENSRRAFKKGLEMTVSELIANGKKPVLFEQVPSYSYSPSNCLVKKATYSWLKEESCNISEKEVMQRQEYANKVIREIENKYANLLVVRVNAIICNGQICKSEINDVPLYKDNDHLNMKGSRVLFHEFKEHKGYSIFNFLDK
ncbi:acyltransferase family protein [Oceanisphaera avium]|uniref:Acyltransferase n=1 Tax=Oceanisphaera avium TaxID=1903694 RepID=A0A1Y0CZL6_9GAMM|nr:acyltransferase family protein [Oceanisphaera avium]ART80337.1 acyltransferase [Oceanisphaera avium]